MDTFFSNKLFSQISYRNRVTLKALSIAYIYNRHASSRSESMLLLQVYTMQRTSYKDVIVPALYEKSSEYRNNRSLNFKWLTIFFFKNKKYVTAGRAWIGAYYHYSLLYFYPFLRDSPSFVFEKLCTFRCPTEFQDMYDLIIIFKSLNSLQKWAQVQFSPVGPQC